MAFADNYLQKHADLIPYIGEKPSPGLTGIIIIPAFRESRLTKCLDSLYQMTPLPREIEVIVFINLPENASPEIRNQHTEIRDEALEYIRTHVRENLKFHIILETNLPAKYFGAGLARKSAMDEAIRRFNQLNNKEGIILSLDADTRVEKNYASAIINLFNENPHAEGCAVHFEHPLEGTTYPPEVYNAIINYELHQRYYLMATRFTGYPHAFHTVGSCFAVKADTYCKQGGMSRRQAGEDFYFIQKIAQNGHFIECNNTTVYPSPRPSNRVPFGTGPAVIKQLMNPTQEYKTYNPSLFFFLKAFYDRIPDFYRNDQVNNSIAGLDITLIEYLQKSGFDKSLEEIKNNVSGEKTFQQRFFRNFNWLWLLKYLHFAEETGIEKIPVCDAIEQLFITKGEKTAVSDKANLLKQLRLLHKNKNPLQT